MQTVERFASNYDVDFLLITALKEERDAVMAHFQKHTVKVLDNIVFAYIPDFETKLPGKIYKVAVLTLPQMGNVDAAIYTTQAINSLRPKFVVMVGIAGGIRGRVEYGDVIISTEIIYYELAKQLPNGAEIRPSAIPVDQLLLTCAQNLDKNFWRQHLTFSSPTQLVGEETYLPEAKFGPFAVGDKVVADGSFLKELLHLHPKIIGIEMESYGVAKAAFSHIDRPRFIAVRGVCDFADLQKNDDWHTFACASAAAYVVGFLKSGMIDFQNSQINNKALAISPARTIIIRHLSLQPISNQSVLDAIQEDDSYRRDIDSEQIEIDIDQTTFFKEGRLVDPEKALLIQSSFPQKIRHLLQEYPDAHVAYFGLAHIPLLFQLGFRLSNKCKLTFFEYDRYSGCWNPLIGSESETNLHVIGLPNKVIEEEGDVILRISISNTILSEEIDAVISSSIASIHMSLPSPKRDSVTSTQQLYRYGATFRNTMDKIHELIPHRVNVHVFYAGPVSLAMYFGQLIHSGVDRNIIVYNYYPGDTPRYSWGIRVTGNSGDEGLVVKPEITNRKEL